jgi:hypothetical protein
VGKTFEEAELVPYFQNPDIQYWNVGDLVAEGPIVIAGYYVSPYCHWGCCRPYGPYRSFDEALQTSRRNWRQWTDADRAPRS